MSKLEFNPTTNNENLKGTQSPKGSVLPESPRVESRVIKESEGQINGAIVKIKGSLGDIYDKTIEEQNTNLENQAKEQDAWILDQLKKKGIDPKEYERRVAKQVWQDKTLGQKVVSVFKRWSRKDVGK